MITLNGKKFAENEKEFIESLFSAGGTCVGYAKGFKRVINLLDHNHNKVGVITGHRVMLNARKTENNRYRYSFMDIDIIGRYNSYMTECEEIQSALEHFGIKRLS